MSLVAAYSESESESDQEQENQNVAKVQVEEETSVEEERPGFEIEDEDDWQTGGSVNRAQTTSTSLGEEASNEIFSKLPEPAAMETTSTLHVKVLIILMILLPSTNIFIHFILFIQLLTGIRFGGWQKDKI